MAFLDNHLNHEDFDWAHQSAEPKKCISQSPFAGPSFTVYFSDEPSLTVPKTLLDHNPQLLRPNNPIMDVTSAVGHSIFYYLLTNTYQSVKGSPLGTSTNFELTNAIRVFNASREYKLGGLERLAQGEIQTLARQLNLESMVSLFRSEKLDFQYKDKWVLELFRPGFQAAQLGQRSAANSSSDSWALGDILLSALSAELAVSDSPVLSDDTVPNGTQNVVTEENETGRDVATAATLVSKEVQNGEEDSQATTEALPTSAEGSGGLQEKDSQSALELLEAELLEAEPFGGKTKKEKKKSKKSKIKSATVEDPTTKASHGSGELGSTVVGLFGKPTSVNMGVLS